MSNNLLIGANQKQYLELRQSQFSSPQNIVKIGDAFKVGSPINSLILLTKILNISKALNQVFFCKDTSLQPTNSTLINMSISS